MPELELTGFELEDLAALKLEPLADLPPLEERDEVEVTLCTTRVGYERLADRLDELVREFDLTCHVKK